MNHQFDVATATEYGVTGAVLIAHFQYWIGHNRANQRNQHDGRTWTYNSSRAFAELFPYLSQDQVKRELRKLTSAGVLITGNYNKRSFDKTAWYAFADENRWLDGAIFPLGDSAPSLGDFAPPLGDSAPRLPLGDFAQPIPIKTTDIKTIGAAVESTAATTTEKAPGPRKLRDDWQPSEQLVQRAIALNLHVANPEQVLAEFKDYWIARGTRRKDWDATFLNRLKAIHNQRKGYHNGQKTSSDIFADMLDAALDYQGPPIDENTLF